MSRSITTHAGGRFELWCGILALTLFVAAAYAVSRDWWTVAAVTLVFGLAPFLVGMYLAERFLASVDTQRVASDEQEPLVSGLTLSTRGSSRRRPSRRGREEEPIDLESLGLE